MSVRGTDNADAWVVFPYDVEGGQYSEILWSEFERRFPRTAKYLTLNRDALREAVEVPKERDRWHLDLYPKNLVTQTGPKVLFPMTIEDTAAAVDERGDLYQDNVNVNAVRSRDAHLALWAIAAVFNSTTFSALARLKAGMNDSGWRKFNRQFAELVPFPLVALRAGAAAERLARMGTVIAAHQDELHRAGSEGERVGARGALAALWRALDAAVDDLYALTPAEREVLARYPRKVDRVELPLRTAAPEEGDAAEE